MLERHWQRLTLVSLLLLPLSLIFCLLIGFRRLLYRLGVLRVVRLPLPVIVVGNITVGGTGKTPLVIWLTDMLLKAGYRPGVITRGYRGRSRSWPVLVASDTSADLVGDEAVLLARRCACPVMAGPDRCASARRLLAQGCNLILSDDGMQHYRLHRDIEIAVIDGQRRFGNGLCLPAGPLREPRSRLESVALRITNGEPRTAELGMRLVPAGFYNLVTRDRQGSAEQFHNAPVHAVAGIGNPERFFATLTALGIKIVPHPFPDHYRFQAPDLEFDDARELIMTEKDAVKCERFADSRYWALAVQAEPDEDLERNILQRLKEVSVGQETA